jgi:hypothetical protein
MLCKGNLPIALGLATLSLSASASTFLAAPEIKEFRLTINGENTQVDSDETIKVRLANGKVLMVAIHQNRQRNFLQVTSHLFMIAASTSHRPTSVMMSFNMQ